MRNSKTTCDRPQERDQRRLLTRGMGFRLRDGLAGILAGARPIFCVLLVTLAPLSPAFGRPAQESAMAAFFEPIEVPLVNVEVYVCDVKGQPVAGLTQDDFEVLEDGHPVTVTHFYAAPRVRAPAGPAGPVEHPEGPAIPPEQQLYLVLYIDDTNIAPNRRHAAFDHIQDFLERAPPPALQLMVATYDGELHIRQPFSNDRGTLNDVLGSLRRRVPLSHRLEEPQLIQQIQMSANATSDPDIRRADGETYRAQILTYARQLRQRTTTSLDTLKRFVRSLSGLQGRTALLWVSDGIETRVGGRLYDFWAAAYPDVVAGSSALGQTGQFDLKKEIRSLVRFANAHRVSFYTLSDMGSRLMGAVSAQVMGLRGSTGSDLFGLPGEEEAAIYVAARTGGRALTNAGLDDQLAEVSVELGSYYSLGYRPEHSGDGQYRTIKVKVRRDDVRIRHREGYNDRTSADRAIDRTLSAAILGVADNPLGVAATCTGQERRADGTYLVSIVVQVPLAQLILVPAAAEHQGQVTILLAVRDRSGRLSDIHNREYPVRVPNDQLMAAVNGDAGFTMSLLMREGPQHVAVGVRDELANAVSTVLLDLDVGASGE